MLLGTTVEHIPLNSDIIEDGHKVSGEQWTGPTTDVCIDEVRDALFDIDNEKALGSDGFGSYSLSLHGLSFRLMFLHLCRNSLGIGRCSSNGTMQLLRSFPSPYRQVG